jgi:hypothetical protein
MASVHREKFDPGSKQAVAENRMPRGRGNIALQASRERTVAARPSWGIKLGQNARSSPLNKRLGPGCIPMISSASLAKRREDIPRTSDVQESLDLLL